MRKKLLKKCCNNCKHGALFGKCEKLNELEEYKELCSNEIQKVSIINDRFIKKRKIKESYCCDDYKNFWLEYPIAVAEVICNDIKYNTCDCGRLVRISPCGKEYENKTYLGFLLGDLSTNISQSYNNKTNVFTLSTSTNPAIFVPELGKIIFGYESWWEEIENESELKEISSDDINNVWYVKILKLMSDKDNKNGI